MKTIKNHHEPFLFYNEKKIKIITSKILNETYNIKFGISSINENIWKLYIVDYDSLEEKEIKTPETFVIEGNIYKRFSEYNGFVYMFGGSYKISYVVGLHIGKDNFAPKYFMVEGDLDITTNTVNNIRLINDTGFQRSGYAYKNYLIYNYYNNLLIDNTADNEDIVSENLDPYFDTLSKIIGVWGDDTKIIVTGYNKNDPKNFKSFLYNTILKQFIPVIHNSNFLIYKCSILETENKTKLLAWTDKVFNFPLSSDYILNIDVL